MIACAINERMQRKLDYTQEEVRVLKDMLDPVHTAASATRRRTGRVKLGRIRWQVHRGQDLLGDGFALDQGD
jgi:CRISPR/Cas system type I-B associated protein Csh2 (Cas7 group RAMP superfamily)